MSRGQRVIVGIRPEDFLIDQPGNTISTTVSLVEPMGSATIVYAPIGEKLIAIETDKATVLRTGVTITLGVEPARIHLFDPATERAIGGGQAASCAA